MTEGHFQPGRRVIIRFDPHGLSADLVDVEFVGPGDGQVHVRPYGLANLEPGEPAALIAADRAARGDGSGAPASGGAVRWHRDSHLVLEGLGAPSVRRSKAMAERRRAIAWQRP